MRLAAYRLTFSFCAATLAASASTIWVSTQNGAGTVSAYSTSGALIGTINATFNNPVGLAQDGSGNVYISDLGNDSILKYNPSTQALSVFTSLPAGSGPFDLAFDGGGNAYVSSLGDGTVSKYDSSGAFEGSVAVPGARGIAFDQFNGDLYVVLTAGTDSIFQVTTSLAATSFVTSNGSDLIAPRYVAFNPNTGLMYVSNTGAGNNTGFIEVFNGAADTGAALTGLSGPNGMAFNNAGDTLYFAEYFGMDIQASSNPGQHSTLASGVNAANGLLYSNVDVAQFTSSPEPGTFTLMLTALGIAMMVSMKMARRPNPSRAVTGGSGPWTTAPMSCDNKACARNSWRE